MFMFKGQGRELWKSHLHRLNASHECTIKLFQVSPIADLCFAKICPHFDCSCAQYRENVRIVIARVCAQYDAKFADQFRLSFVFSGKNVRMYFNESSKNKRLGRQHSTFVNCCRYIFLTAYVKACSFFFVYMGGKEYGRLYLVCRIWLQGER